MKLTDFKFWYITRDDDGYILEAAVRFFEGEVTTKKENGIDVTRYRRSERLNPKTEIHLKNNQMKKDAKGRDVALFFPSHFGRIKTDNELREAMNTQIRKDKKRIQNG